MADRWRPSKAVWIYREQEIIIWLDHTGHEQVNQVGEYEWMRSSYLENDFDRERYARARRLAPERRRITFTHGSPSVVHVWNETAQGTESRWLAWDDFITRDPARADIDWKERDECQAWLYPDGRALEVPQDGELFWRVQSDQERHRVLIAAGNRGDSE